MSPGDMKHWSLLTCSRPCQDDGVAHSGGRRRRQLGRMNVCKIIAENFPKIIKHI